MNAAIVTGVSRGLGESLVVALLARGWHVLGVGRTSTPRASGPRYRFVAHDLADAAGIDAALAAPFEALARERPAAACLMNNAAAVEPVGALGTLAGADIAASLAVNLAAPAALANLFCRVFVNAGDRRIVNVSSGAAARALPGGGAYSIAKAGLEMLTCAIAAEQGAQGIVAVSLRPGILDTGMQAFMRGQPEARLPAVGMFRDFHAGGQLVAPDVAAATIVERVVLQPLLQGRTYSYAEL
jgi:benzil reductase ((S)-benzoin forming)